MSVPIGASIGDRYAGVRSYGISCFWRYAARLSRKIAYR